MNTLQKYYELQEYQNFVNSLPVDFEEIKPAQGGLKSNTLNTKSPQNGNIKS